MRDSGHDFDDGRARRQGSRFQPPRRRARRCSSENDMMSMARAGVRARARPEGVISAMARLAPRTAWPWGLRAFTADAVRLEDFDDDFSTRKRIEAPPTTCGAVRCGATVRPR